MSLIEEIIEALQEIQAAEAEATNLASKALLEGEEWRAYQLLMNNRARQNKIASIVTTVTEAKNIGGSECQTLQH